MAHSWYCGVCTVFYSPPLFFQQHGVVFVSPEIFQMIISSDRPNNSSSASSSQILSNQCTKSLNQLDYCDPSVGSNSKCKLVINEEYCCKLCAAKRRDYCGDYIMCVQICRHRYPLLACHPQSYPLCWPTNIELSSLSFPTTHRVIPPLLVCHPQSYPLFVGEITLYLPPIDS